MNNKTESRSNIIIKKGKLITEANKVKYVIPIEKDNLPFFELTFCMDEQYGKYIVEDRSDAAVLAIIERCMKNSWNIYSEMPISEDLIYQIETYIIPFFSKNWDNMHNIQIFAELISTKITTAGKTGTGFSGGVDSFYSVIKHIGTRYCEHNLEYLLLMQNGAAGSNVGGEKASKWLEETSEFLKEYALKLNLSLITIGSNIADFYKEDKCFNGDLIVSMSFVHLLRKLLGIYYWGSGYEFSTVKFNTDDTGHWDQLLINYVSVDGLHIYESGLEASRMEKIQFIATNNVVQKAISVCGVEIRNCGRCVKCLRTMSELYVVNSLELFEASFPVDDFKKNKVKRLAEEIAIDNDEYVIDILNKLKEREKKTYNKVILVSKLYRIMWFFRRLLKNNKIVQWIYLKLNLDMYIAGRKSDLRKK